jgi:hypothetical protein
MPPRASQQRVPSEFYRRQQQKTPSKFYKALAIEESISTLVTRERVEKNS